MTEQRSSIVINAGSNYFQNGNGSKKKVTCFYGAPAGISMSEMTMNQLRGGRDAVIGSERLNTVVKRIL